MGQALYCSAADAGVWGERGHGDVSTPYIYSAVLPCFHGCLAFLHRRLSSQSPPSYPLDLSLCNQQQPLPWDWCTILKLQLPVPAPSRRPVTLSGICMAVARTVWFSFHLDCHRSAVSLSVLNIFLWLRQLPRYRDRIPASVPPPAKGRSSPTNTPVFPLVPSSYWVLCGSMYPFLLVRHSCPLSAGVLLALLCLKLYFWCIRGERWTPCPPTPLPSCSLPAWVFSFFLFSPSLIFCF